MAEYVLGYILLLERKLLLAKSQQEAKVLAPTPLHTSPHPTPQHAVRSPAYLADRSYHRHAPHAAYLRMLAWGLQEWVESPFKDGTRPLAGLTLGLLGCGDIGQQIVKAAKAMGLKTAAFKRDTSSPGAFRSVVRRVCVTVARWPVVVAASRA
eukprot:COSAG06_NODE_3398_length_5397_cov_11.111929_3_plen_153_part_00